jgi:hypothetical protein
VTSGIPRRNRPLVRVRGTSGGQDLDLRGAPAELSPIEGLARWGEFNQRRQES